MSRVSLHRGVRAELDLLVAQRLLTGDQASRLRERYPTEPWDLVSLARWLTIVGALAAGGGVVLLGAQLDAWRTLLELALAGAAVGLVLAARWLGRSRGLVRTQAALELLASFAAQGLTAALAIHYSHHSDHWPALIGVDTVLAGALAYGLRNRLILIHALVCFFTFFGGETGYESGWGAYWLGMDYPVRFLAAGLAALGVARLHSRAARDQLRAFARVYLHFGLLIANLSLWFLAVFGYFETEVRWDGTEGQRLAFSALWAAASVASAWASGRFGLSTLRAYGLTFLVINVYTFYFQFVAAHSAELWFLHLLLIGGSLVVLALRAERLRRKPDAPPSPE